VRPGEVWLDDQGRAIEAHGGAVVRHGPTFYWFGENHADGWAPATRKVSCYASNDLIHWTNRGSVLSLGDVEHLGPGWILERPRVFYSAKTKRFVMYAHIDDAKYKFARVAVLVSEQIDGRYSYVRSFRPFNQESRDIGEFVDDDGTNYLIFESRPTGGFFVAKLSLDALRLQQQIAFIHEPLEGGAIAHVNGYYFFVGSHLTGYKSNPDIFASAAELAGPWTPFRDIAPPETNTWDSQSTMLLKVVGSQTTSLIFIGDRWNVSHLADSRYIWMPLQIKGAELYLSRPQPWTIDVVRGSVTLLP
jgi:hypothetical protein